MKSKGSSRWQWATGVFGFYQWLKTDAPVTFREDGMGMLGQMLGSVIPSKIEVPLPCQYGNQYPAVLAARQQQSAHQR